MICDLEIFRECELGYDIITVLKYLFQYNWFGSQETKIDGFHDQMLA